MPNLEKPADPQESSVEQRKKAIAAALEAGDFETVAKLAQEAGGAEVVAEAPADTADAAPTESPEAKAQRDAEQAEQMRLQKENDSQEAAALLAKMQGGTVESQQEDVSLSAEAQGVEGTLMRLFTHAELAGFDRDPELNSVRAAIGALDEQTQEKLGQDFFDNTIGQYIGNNRNAYKVYQRCFKGTALGRKFAGLEDARLKASGYPGFTL
jgi:hypothetical protein